MIFVHIRSIVVDLSVYICRILFRLKCVCVKKAGADDC